MSGPKLAGDRSWCSKGRTYRLLGNTKAPHYRQIVLLKKYKIEMRFCGWKASLEHNSAEQKSLPLRLESVSEKQKYKN